MTVLGGMAHVRRKFIEIVKRTRKAGKAQVAVNYIAKLYAVEKQARGQNLDPDNVFKLRQEKSKPILDKFKVFLEDLVQKVPPKSALGSAISYALSHCNRSGGSCYNAQRGGTAGQKVFLKRLKDKAKGVSTLLFAASYHGK